MTAAVSGDGSAFQVGLVRALFETRPRRVPAATTAVGINAFPYDVSADGQRFLVNTLMQGRSSAHHACRQLDGWTQAMSLAVTAPQHPHICTLHDVGHQDGVADLVLEYLDGQTLADRLTRGALPIDQALGLCVPSYRFEDFFWKNPMHREAHELKWADVAHRLEAGQESRALRAGRL
jgi:hypothetical protein